MSQVIDEADRLGLSVRVTALKHSDANRFYQRHGFELFSTPATGTCTMCGPPPGTAMTAPTDPLVLLAADQGLHAAVIGVPGAAQRRAVAKTITLLESTRPDHREQCRCTAQRPAAATSGRSFRLGISGVPGVGKSTFIEALGLFLIERGHRVAVLTVDPSSSISGGSILGDKTRMERLSMDTRAYIRPSPSSGTLGGVAEKTREAMLVCEAAGHDVVIVETVGVGQSETAVAGMTDMFVLLQLPNAGDDLQAIKKGVMELADLVVINKADLDEAAATRARAQISSSLRLIGMHGNADHLHHDQQVWHPARDAAQCAQGLGPGRVLGGHHPLPRSADRQRPALQRPPPAAGSGLDVEPDRCRASSNASKAHPAVTTATAQLTRRCACGARGSVRRGSAACSTCSIDFRNQENLRPHA